MGSGHAQKYTSELKNHVVEGESQREKVQNDLCGPYAPTQDNATRGKARAGQCATSRQPVVPREQEMERRGVLKGKAGQNKEFLWHRVLLITFYRGKISIHLTHVIKD